jgi:hypothetical protein
MNPSVTDPRPQRALRLAVGVALGTALGFGLALPLPFLTPVLVLFLLAMSNQPLGLKGSLILALVVGLTCSCGLLLLPLLRHSPPSGVLLVALGLFLCFRFALRGGSGLVANLMVVGLTLITAAGTASMALGQEVLIALVKAALLTGLCVSLVHALFPEPIGLPPAPAPTPASDPLSSWIALRATLVVVPTWLLAMVDPASYLALIMKAVSLGQQTCVTNARMAGRELLGSTLLGGLLAIALWSLLSILPHLWLFFLLVLLFVLLLARRLYQLTRTRYSASFWLNTAITLLILLGQSVQDSASGKDVYTAFAVRMCLFILVTLYAYLAVLLIDQRSPIPGADKTCS